VIDLAKNRQLLVFAAVVSLFQFANAPMLPLVSESLAVTKIATAPMLLSGLIVAPELIVAILAPWIGYHSERKGRKPLLLIGIGIVAVRAILLGFATNYAALLTIQMLDGVSGSIMNVLTVLMITDLTAGTGRFNLAQGAIGTMMAIAASLSIGVTGFLFQEYGRVAGFLAIATVAAGATGTAWALLPETKPEQYHD
jgi:MFS family permease